MRALLRRIYHTLSEPRFKTGAIVTAYAVTAILGVDLMIEFGGAWANNLALTTLSLGSMLALIAAWRGNTDWEPVGLWLILAGLASTIVLEFSNSLGALRNVAIAFLLIMFAFAIFRMVTLKRLLYVEVTHARYD